MSVDSPDKDAIIYLAGEDNFVHGALSYVLEREVRAQCVMLKRGEPIPAAGPPEAASKVLFLIDCLERNSEKDLVSIGIDKIPQRTNTVAGFFNLQKGTGVERRAFMNGIKGFFYRDDSLAQMLKGIRALLAGEVWISRDILVQVAMQGRAQRNHAVEGKTTLSPRETEILALLSVGSSNDEIAEKLAISPNTVKTHLYRVFQKIKVPNRFQAALWAAKNLS